MNQSPVQVSEFDLRTLFFVFGISTVLAVVWLLNEQYSMAAHRLYNYLAKRYPDDLKTIATSPRDFPLTDWSSPPFILGHDVRSAGFLPFIRITRYGIFDQFRTFKALLSLNPSDDDLHVRVTQLQSILIRCLTFIPISFVVLFSVALILILD